MAAGVAAGSGQTTGGRGGADATPARAPAPAVRVEGVGKRFDLRAARSRTSDLRELFSVRRHPARGGGGPDAASDFWALRDVSFTIDPGEAVGIVGHNGSGKSTMLKLLTGILKPTEGAVSARGRVGALIEVGAGFHPDLSGRENVFLNGSILGLSRRDIASRFDEIVAFAGLEQFIDTPVKRYSSGMYMRLGFSIAVSIDPEILLIDEVLAVGDEVFQRKCLKRLREFSEQGGTIVFVSHSMGQVASLCSRCIWLDRGRLQFDGPPQDAIDRYLAMVAEREDEELRRTKPDEWELLRSDREAAEREKREAAERAEARRASWGRARDADDGRPALLGASLLAADGGEPETYRPGEPVEARVAFRIPRARRDLVVGLEFIRGDELYQFGANNKMFRRRVPAPAGRGEMRVRIPTLALNAGRYRMRVALYAEPDDNPDWWRVPEDVLEEGVVFVVAEERADGASAHGCTFLPLEGWEVRSLSD